MPELHWTEVDGVPTVWAEASGPRGAGLVFRSGRVDETLAGSGRGHLVEHLVLSSIEDPTDRHNGYVDGVTTAFYTRGTDDEVVAFLARVCGALGELPAARLEAEKKLLAAEAAGRAADQVGRLLTARYGAAGYGLLGLPEFGIEGASLEQLRADVTQRFTRGNALLWMTGPPPPGLRLPLAPGPRLPVPPPAPLPSSWPCWFTDERCGGVALSFTAARESAVSLFRSLAVERMRARLRMEAALSYSPVVGYDLLTAGRAHLTLFADSDAARRDELVGAFLEVVEGLGTVPEAELETLRARILQEWQEALRGHPDEVARQALGQAAVDWALGRAPDPLEELVEGLKGVTAAQVEAVGRGLRADALVALPEKVQVRPWLGARAPDSYTAAVQGAEFAHLDAPLERSRFVHAPEGLTLRLPDGIEITVRYAQLGVALAWADGAVALIGLDATQLIVEPGLWRDGPRLCQAVRERVPPGLLVSRPARAQEAITRPTTTAWQRLRARFGPLAAGLGGGLLALAGLYLLISLFDAPGTISLFPIAIAIYFISQIKR